MNLDKKIYKTQINEEEATLEFSKLAGKSDASLIARHGGTTVFVSVVMSKEDKNLPFFPLTVDYEEKFYAIGKILGSRFMRREGRPSDEATLSARLIDRTIRPLFDKRLRRDVQVTIYVLEYNKDYDPDRLALLATSTALGVSNIPWDGPVAGFSSETEDQEIFFSGPKDRINMIEFKGKDVPEDELVRIFSKAQEEINKLVDFQNEIIKERGEEKEVVEFAEASPELKELSSKFLESNFETYFEKGEVGELESVFKKELREKEIEQDEISKVEDTFYKELEDLIKEKAIKEGKRADGRKVDEVRELYGEVGTLKTTHGSGLFFRGETQILSVTTLASPNAEQLLDGIRDSGRKRFMLHYNFPQFSVGDTGRARGPGRREIGHGTLALKTLESLIPSKEEFPYTIRIVAESMSSNGSTSMATVCASSLSLMDAGVKIEKHAAGIAMGIMYKNDDEWAILTDIQGPEDHFGDMDLKVAGTKDGVNAIQMDVKIKGITKEIFEKSLPMAKKAREEILEVMNSVIPEPRESLSPNAPSIIRYKIDPNKIGGVIGSGGKTINNIRDVSGNEIDDVEIDIDDDGNIFISSSKKDQAEKALKMIEQITKEYEVGEIVEGEIEKILDFGAIVDLGGGRSGMIHVSELADKFTDNVKDIVKMGEKVKAKVINVEPGKIGLSLKKV
ncbi:MAG: polyribonucleotide nucleotidyltransferase [Candidatus Paceibacterota bacterium]